MAGDIPLTPERPLDPVLDLDHPETLQRPTRGRFRPALDPLRIPDPLQPATESLRGDRNPQVHEEYEMDRNPGRTTAALGAGSLYRPKSSSGPSAALGNPYGAKGTGKSPLQGITPPRPQDSFAAVVRPRHMGAYTDAEPPAMDEATKALQTIAKTLTSKDEAVRPQLRAIQFPVNIGNRIAFGLASMSIGGRDLRTLPDYSVAASDFPLTTEEDFDSYGGAPDSKMEKRLKAPSTLSHWYRNALRQAWAIACVYGAEHYACWEEAAGFLLKLGEDHVYAWPPHAIFSVWEELWARFTEEMKELDRNLRRETREEAPSFDRIRFFATSPDFNGDPWLTLPRTFFLEDEGEYFQTDVVPRHNRLLSRACWQTALRRNPVLHLTRG